MLKRQFVLAPCHATWPLESPQLIRPVRTAASLLLASLGLAACAAVGPDYQAPQPAAPAEWSRVDATEQPVTSPAATGDLSQWWQTLNDPLLTELVEEAMLASPDLRSAQARLREARARRTVAGAGLYPDVDAAAAASRKNFSEESGAGISRDLYSAGFDARWEIDVFGGLRRSVEAADADFESSQASLGATRVSLAAEVASNYIEVRAQQRLLGIARANLETQSETLQLTEWRAQAGIVSIQDVEQARSNSEQTRAQIPFIQASLAAAEHNLDILLGHAPGTLHARVAVAAALPEVPRQVAVGIPADTLRQRPDVRAAERTLAAETARVGVAEAARYPNFNLFGTLGLESLTLGSLGIGAATSSIGADVTAPIFDGGRRRAQVEVQDALREQAQVAYEQTVLAALQEAENALVDLARNRERGEALANAVASARSAADLARLRYGAGLIDFQSVLSSERSALVLEESLARNRADEVLALIRLYKALGGGWSAQAESVAASEHPR